MDNGPKKSRIPNPQLLANPFSAATYAYMFPLFIKGFRRNLEESDLFDILPEADATQLAGKAEKIWNKEILKAKQLEKTPSLTKVLAKVFFWESISLMLTAAISEMVWIAIPIMFGYYLSYFDPKETEIPKIHAYGYASGIILSQILNVVLGQYYLLGSLHTGMKLKTVCSSLIYRKVLKLNTKAQSQTSGGQIINILSNDMDKFNFVSTSSDFIVIAPLECILITYLLYREVQVSAFIGMAVIIIIIPIQISIGYVTRILRESSAQRTDKRIKITNEIISGIQVIKMYVWEKLFSDSIFKIRRSEMKWIRLKFYLRGILDSFQMFITRIAVFATVIAYVLFGETLTAKKVFVVYICFCLIRSSTTYYFSEGMLILAEALTTIKRINDFLLLEELPDETNTSILTTRFNNSIGYYKQIHQIDKIVKPFLHLKEITADWTETSDDETLKNINLQTKSPNLVGIVGFIGSGKTSLLHVICKELLPSSGRVEMEGTISYASQEPWLFTGTVRDNILFGQPMDTTKYQHVIKVCCLESDLNMMPYADLTCLGDRGVSVSGGQRARINLARAVYRDADIYLLDDPFSSLDAHVGKHIFENCISGYLKDRIVILSTHQMYLLKGVKHVVYLENGQVGAQGSYEDLMISNPELATITGNRVEENKEKQIDVSLDENLCEKKIQTSNKKDSQENKMLTVSVSSRVCFGYIKSVGSYLLVLTVLFLFIFTSGLSYSGDYLLAVWTEAKEEVQNGISKPSDKYKYLSAEFDLSKYNSSGEEFSLNLLNDTAKKENIVETPNEYSFIIIYTALSLSLIMVCLARSIAFYYFCSRASIKLHKNMFSRVIRATLKFFSDTGSGDILNHFSSDMGIVDELIPFSMMDTLQIGFITLSVLAIVISVDLWFIIPSFIMITCVILLSIVYLKTSREIKRMEQESRSAVYGHTNATLQGLTTIRAFNAQNILEREFDSYLNIQNSAQYTYLQSSRAFAFWLDILCAIFTSWIILKFLIIPNGAQVGSIGLAIVQGITLSRLFQWGVRQMTELQNQFVSVGRILTYNSIEIEAKHENVLLQKPPSDWPRVGKIEFRDLYLRYSKEEPPVLQHLNFVVHPRERIGIVGRTGAGKSSLINAIFQLAKTEGKILIDETDITKISLDDLRWNISIIPQQPMLFTGTLRQNLDPFGKFLDEEMWQVLKDVELESCPSIFKDGLDCQIEEGAANFSIGQKQLICLARAILCKNKILILDEATANVDHATDVFIQETIREKFRDCTVLTIAHRMNTVIDSDKILVMDAGKIVEFDSPHVLLKNKKGCFYKMLQKTDNMLIN